MSEQTEWTSTNHDFRHDVLRQREYEQVFQTSRLLMMRSSDIVACHTTMRATMPWTRVVCATSGTQAGEASRTSTH
jgi:hypothetical protein